MYREDPGIVGECDYENDREWSENYRSVALIIITN